MVEIVSGENKVCDQCGVEIPNSEHRSMSDLDTYWCDECEQDGPESAEELDQRLTDREALGVEPRPDNPVGWMRRDDEGGMTWGSGAPPDDD